MIHRLCLLLILFYSQLHAFQHNNSWMASLENSIYFNKAITYYFQAIKTTYDFSHGLSSYEEFSTNIYFYLRSFNHIFNQLEATIDAESFKKMKEYFNQCTLSNIKVWLKMIINHHILYESVCIELLSIIDYMDQPC